MARSMTAQEMYAHLAEEFAKARAAECTTCQAPKPFWGPAPGPSASGYWYMESPRKCGRGCREVLTRVWAQITTEYEIAPPPRDRIVSRSAFSR
jgi:hypothetical protein